MRHLDTQKRTKFEHAYEAIEHARMFHKHSNETIHHVVKNSDGTYSFCSHDEQDTCEYCRDIQVGKAYYLEDETVSYGHFFKG